MRINDKYVGLSEKVKDPQNKRVAIPDETMAVCELSSD